MLKSKISVNLGGFDTAFADVLRIIDANLSEVASDVENNAKTTAAFADKTGNLRDSIVKKKSRYENGGYIVTASSRGNKKGYHAANVEFGHVMIAWGKIIIGRRVPPHPFMRPALEKGIQKAITVFRGIDG